MSRILEEIALSALRKLHRAHSHEWPQLAVYSLDVIGRHVVSKGRYEREVLDCLEADLFKFLQRRDIALDIGANIGNHSVFFADHFSRVMSFEPNPKTFQLLNINSTLRQNIVPFPIGCSSSRHVSKAFFSNGNLGDASLHNSPGADQADFQLDRLDDLITEQEHARIDFIKLDIEGHELDALCGATRILAHGPKVAFEVQDLSQTDFWNYPVVTYLVDCGYSNFYALSNQAPLANLSRSLSNLFNALYVLFFGKRISQRKYRLEKIGDKLPNRFDGHPIIASRSELGLQRRNN